MPKCGMPVATNVYTALRARVPQESVSPQQSPARLSGNRVTALGLEDNLAGQYLLIRHPALFQGVGNAVDYEKSVTKNLAKLREDVGAGKYFNTGINTKPYEAQYGRPLSTMEEKSKFDQFIKLQKEVQLGWLDYLSEGGYTPEVQLLLLGSVVRETAQLSEGGTWKFLSLGKNSERLPERASPELAGRFAAEVLQPENWEKRPAQILGEVSAALELESRELRLVGNADVQSGGDTLQWVKFPSKVNDPDNFDVNVAALTALAKTSGNFGQCTWCTGTGAARGQLAMGDFWIGVDDQGRSRVAVRLQGKDIGEIRGVLAGQNLEPKYAAQTLGLINREGMRGGDKFVADAKVKGALAELSASPTWDEYKQALGLENDQEAIQLSFHYASPGYQRNREGLPFNSSNTQLLRLVYDKAHELSYPAPPDHLVTVREPWVAEFITPEGLAEVRENPTDNLLRQFVRAGNFSAVAHLVTPEMLRLTGGLKEAFISGQAKDVESKITADMLLPDQEWFMRKERLGDEKPLWQTSMLAGTFSDYRRIFMQLNGGESVTKLDDLLHWDLQTDYGTINGVMYAATQGCLSEVRDFVRPSDYEQRDREQRSLCHYAFAFGEVDAIDSSRPEIWQRDGKGRMPHHYGLRHGWYEKIKQFCTPEAMVCQDHERKTPLHVVEHILPLHWLDKKGPARWEELKSQCAKPWDEEYELLTEANKKILDETGQTPVVAAVRRGDGDKIKIHADQAKWKVKDESNPIFTQVVFGRSLEPVKEHISRENLIGSAALNAIVRNPDMLRQVMPLLDKEVLTTPCPDSTGQLGSSPVFEIARAGLLGKVLHLVDKDVMGLEDAYGDRLIHCVVGGRDHEEVDKTLGKMAERDLLTEEVWESRDSRNRTAEDVAGQFQNLTSLQKYRVRLETEDLLEI